MSAPTKSHGRKSISATVKPRELMSDNPDLAHVWMAKVITLVPEAFPGILGSSLTGRGLRDGLWQISAVDLRRFGEGKHRNVDDTPAGGGAGMVLRADVLANALDHAALGTNPDKEKWPVIYLSPRGKPFDQNMARRFSQSQGLTMLCGRFEGVDERVLEEYEIEEVSLGDFVMTGGEIAAMAIIDATVRLLPGILGNDQSAIEESFSDGKLEHPQYTKPALWRDREIPKVLLSGNHAEIEKWRQQQSLQVTKTRRPDLLEED